MSSERFCCDKCPKSFRTRGRYNQHLKTHSRPFRCKPCQRGFALRRDLDRHMNARHRVGHEPHRCPHDSPSRRCHFESNRKDNLVRHLRNFHGDESSTFNKEVQRGTVVHGADTPSKLCSTSLITLKSPGQFYSIPFFMKAATIGNIDILDASLKWGIDINSKAKDGSTALHCAARAGQTAAVQYLIKNGASTEDENANYRKPLEEAILGQNPSTVEILLDVSSTAKGYYQVGDYLARSGSLEIVQMYIERLPKESRGVLMLRIFTATLRSGQNALAATLLGHSDLPQTINSRIWNAPIHQIVRYGQVEVLNLLLASEGFDVNIQSKRSSLTPLCLAASKGHQEIVEILLKQPSIMVNLKTEYSHAPLHFAADQGHVKVVEHLLIRQDIDVNLPGGYKKQIPLHLSARNGHLEIVKLLLSRDDISINYGDSDRQTPLHLAASSGHFEVVKLLLNQSCIEENCKDRVEQSPLHLAAFSEQWEIVSMLLDHWDTTNFHISTSKQIPAGKPIEKLGQIARLWRHPDFQDIQSKRFRGQTLLHRSVQLEGFSVLESALSCEDVNVNVIDDYGRTLLCTAVVYRNVEATKILLQHKDIDINCGPGSNSDTLLGFARERNYKDMENLLLSHGVEDDSSSSKVNNNQPTITEVLDPPPTIQPEPELESGPYSLFDEYMEDLETDDLDMDDIYDTDATA